jgi:hypothetical protein
MCCHHDFPLRKTAYNLLSGSAFLVTGGLVTLSVGVGWLDAYLAALLAGLILTVATVCNRCAYFGHRCALGIGRLVPLVRSRGQIEEFCKTWPQILAVGFLIMAPVIAGVCAVRLLMVGQGLLPSAFLAAMLAFVLPHPRWMCRYCAQREQGPCPVGRGLVRLTKSA